MFSTTEKPAPTAKPMMTASSLKPIRLILNSPMMTTAFSASSIHGATNRL